MNLQRETKDISIDQSQRFVYLNQIRPEGVAINVYIGVEYLNNYYSAPESNEQIRRSIRFIFIFRHKLMDSLKSHLLPKQGNSLPHWFQPLQLVLNSWLIKLYLSAFAICLQTTDAIVLQNMPILVQCEFEVCLKL